MEALVESSKWRKLEDERASAIQAMHVVLGMGELRAMAKRKHRWAELGQVQQGAQQGAEHAFM